MELNLKSKRIQWATMLGLATIWGSSFILMKRGLESFNEVEMAALRMSFAILFMIPFAFTSFKKVKREQVLPVLAVGILGNAGPAFLFAIAQSKLDSSFVGILNSMVPLFTLSIGATMFGLTFVRNQLFGVAIGFLGAIGLVYANGLGTGEINILYSLAIVGATISYGITVNIIKKYLHELNAMTITSVAFAMVSPAIFGILFTTDFTSKLITPTDWQNLGYLAILGCIGTALAVLVFNKLIKHTSALFAASVTYLIPIVALLWGMADGETITLFHIGSMGVILLGVYLVNRG